MSILDPRSSNVSGAVHPAVFDRRVRDIFALALTALIPAVLALAIVVEMPEANIALVLGAVVCLVGIVALMVCTRLELTVALLALYLGLLDGPVKLAIGAHELTASVRNVLIGAVVLGALMRIVVRREKVKLPPLSGWVIAFVTLVAIEAFNPRTGGILKVLGGFRQQLQWVPFFFFGYLLLRSKRRLRQLFLIVGVIGLANGVVSAYQTSLSPAQIAAWGPGYRQLIFPTQGTGRTYSSEGETRVRPPALGSEAGSGGGIGVIALPFSLALLTVMPLRRRWIPAILALGAMVAIITGLGRLQVVGAGLGVVAFAGLAFLAGQRVTRTIGTLLAIIIIAVPSGLLLASVLRTGTFKRYESIGTSSSTTLHKEGALKLIPHYLQVAPFGLGLGSVGPVSGLGGRNTNVIEGHRPTSETQYNFIVDELGAPGLVLWVALSLFIAAIIVRGMRRVRDGDLGVLLAGLFAPYMALLFEATSGPLSNSAAAGPYFWTAIGAAGYWFVGPGRAAAGAVVPPSWSEPRKLEEQVA